MFWDFAHRERRIREDSLELDMCLTQLRFFGQLVFIYRSAVGFFGFYILSNLIF